MKILRKIFDPNKNRDGSWRIRTNEEPDKLIKGKKYVTREIKSSGIMGNTFIKNEGRPTK